MTLFHKPFTFVLMTALMATAALAQQPGQQTQTQSVTGAIDTKTNATMVRASTLIGHSLVNSKQESVGSIHDIVMDANNGKIRYVVVTYGGILGIGNKLFAVPYEALKCTTKPNDPKKYQLVLDVTKEQMEGAEGFDEDNWPDFYDPKFHNELMNRYRVKHPDLGVRDRINRQ
jgi:sporulation protein YlmC with PRC-barrel domain